MEDSFGKTFDHNNIIKSALATGSESGRFDFKEILDPTDSKHKITLVKMITSFANTEQGGYLIVGIDDNCEVKGLEKKYLDSFDQTKIANLLERHIAPTPEFLVRKVEYEGKNLVIIDVTPFKEIPHIVTNGTNEGKEKLVAGVLYIRSGGAKATPVCSETELHRLCESIAQKKADSITALILRGLTGVYPNKNVLYDKSKEEPIKNVISEVNDNIVEARKLSLNYWPEEYDKKTPYIETYFNSISLSEVKLSIFKELIPKACVPVENNFPFTRYSGIGRSGKLFDIINESFMGMNPYYEVPDAENPPVYMWALTRKLAFFYREPLWEDFDRSVIKGGVGLYHLIGQIILLIRFLHRIILFQDQEYKASSMIFQVGIRLNNMKGRYLSNEKGNNFFINQRTAQKDVLEYSMLVSGQELIDTRMEIATTMAEEIAWKFGRDDLSRTKLSNLFDNARYDLGANYHFPHTENVIDDPWNIKY